MKDPKRRARFAALAIPPAWTEVWICPHVDGHIQATGRDAAGRKQYVYHPRWRRARDRVKYDRMIEFGRALPRIRRRVGRDLEREGLSREKVLAAVVRLLECSLARVGNDEYARRNASYGLTTIRKRHVDGEGLGDELVLEFEGKGSKPWRIEVDDPRVAEVVAECLEVPGYELFKYFEPDGLKRDVTSDDVNGYLREVSGADVTAKDFRTWAGTVLCVRALCELHQAHPEDENDKTLLRAVEKVAGELGNSPSICREAYIHPQVLDGFADGALVAALSRLPRRPRRRERGALAPEEAALLAFLENRLRS